MASFNNTTSTNGTEDCVVIINTTRSNGTDDEGIQQYVEAAGLRIFRLSLFSLVILASLVGNSVVYKAVWSMPFRKPFSYFLVANMAFAEILSTLCLPFILANFESDAFSVVSCILNPLQVLSLTVVTHSMAAISFYRYKVFIQYNPQSLTRKMKLGTVVCLWVVPTAISVPMFFAYKFVNGKFVCQPQSLLNNNAYVLVKFILQYPLPYLVMLVSYGTVAWNLRKRIAQKEARAMAARNSMVPSSTEVVEIEDVVKLQCVAIEGNLEDERTRQVLLDASNRRCSKPENADLEKDLLRMIYAIILIFVVCYFPYQAVFLWERIAKVRSWQFRYHSLLQNYVFVLRFLPSALHPLCYGTMNNFYAKAFSKIFLCKVKSHTGCCK